MLGIQGVSFKERPSSLRLHLPSLLACWNKLEKLKGDEMRRSGAIFHYVSKYTHISLPHPQPRLFWSPPPPPTPPLATTSQFPTTFQFHFQTAKILKILRPVSLTQAHTHTHQS